MLDKQSSATSYTVILVEVIRYNEIFTDYNKEMGGVDKSDQITDQYASGLKTMKC